MQNCILFVKGLGMATFSERLKEMRKKRKLTQSELAEITSANQGTVARWEKGQLEPNIEQILLLSEALHTSIDYLLGSADYDGKNMPTVEEHALFTAEQLAKFNSDMYKQGQLGNRKLGYQLARDNEEVRKMLGITEEEIDPMLEQVMKTYIRETLEEIQLKKAKEKGEE